MQKCADLQRRLEMAEYITVNYACLGKKETKKCSVCHKLGTVAQNI